MSNSNPAANVIAELLQDPALTGAQRDRLRDAAFALTRASPADPAKIRPTPRLFFGSLREGDLDWFTDLIAKSPSDAPAPALRAIRRWAEAVDKENPAERVYVRIPRDELHAVYDWICGAGISPAKFTRMCHYHGIPTKKMRIDGPPVRGAKILFHRPGTNS